MKVLNGSIVRDRALSRAWITLDPDQTSRHLRRPRIAGPDSSFPASGTASGRALSPITSIRLEIAGYFVDDSHVNYWLFALATAGLSRSMLRAGPQAVAKAPFL
jgi:hypothetical protein